MDHNFLTSKLKDAMKETKSYLNSSIGSSFYVNARNECFSVTRDEKEIFLIL